jgi:hypothetical protein
MGAPATHSVSEGLAFLSRSDDGHPAPAREPNTLHLCEEGATATEDALRTHRASLARHRTGQPQLSLVNSSSRRPAGNSSSVTQRWLGWTRPWPNATPRALLSCSRLPPALERSLSRPIWRPWGTGVALRVPSARTATRGRSGRSVASGAKERRGHVTKEGRSYVRWLLVQAAWVAVRTDAYFRQVFHRISRRRDRQIAIVAVAHELSCTGYAMLATGTLYQDPADGMTRVDGRGRDPICLGWWLPYGRISHRGA